MGAMQSLKATKIKLNFTELQKTDSYKLLAYDMDYSAVENVYLLYKHFLINSTYI